MAIPQSREELLKAMDSGFSKLWTDLGTISDAAATTPSMEGHAKGTTMSVKDLVAYLTGWGELVLKWNELRGSGQQPDFPETGYKWNELGALAAKFYRDYASLSYSDLLIRHKSTHEDLMKLVRSLDDDSLYGHPWYGKWTLGRMIQFNTASPYNNAHIRLRKWKKQATLLTKKKTPADAK